MSNHYIPIFLKGIEAGKSELNFTSQKLIPMKVIIRFLFLIMITLNNFVFHGIYYLQKIGCAVGTIGALNYADIFIGSGRNKDFISS